MDRVRIVWVAIACLLIVASCAGGAAPSPAAVPRSTATTPADEPAGTPTPSNVFRQKHPTPTPNPGPVVFQELTRRSSSRTYVKLLALLPDTPFVRASVQVKDYAKLRRRLGIPLPGTGEPGTAKYVYTTMLMDAGGGDIFFPSHEQYQDPYLLELSYYITEMERLVLLPFDSWLSGMNPGAGGLPAEGRPRGRLTSEKDPSGAICCPSKQFLGFDQSNVDQSLMLGESPLAVQKLSVIVGRLDPAATDRAIKACRECPLPEVVRHSGVRYYRWGDRYQIKSARIGRPPVFDFLGRGPSLYVAPSYALAGYAAKSNDLIDPTRGRTDGMDALIEAARGRIKRLSGNRDFVLLAKAMDQLDPVAFQMTTSVRGYDAFLDEWKKENANGGAFGDFEADHGAGPFLRPYQGIAAGYALDEKRIRYRVVVAILHRNEAEAKENRRLVELRLNEARAPTQGDLRDYVESVSARADGRTLLLELEGPRVAVAWGGFLKNPQLFFMYR